MRLSGKKLDEKHPKLVEMAVHDERADNGPNYKSGGKTVIRKVF